MPRLRVYQVILNLMFCGCFFFLTDYPFSMILILSFLEPKKREVAFVKYEKYVQPHISDTFSDMFNPPTPSSIKSKKISRDEVRISPL